MDRIGDLNLFLRVVDLGSISAAARSLDVSVAVASQRLKRLEKHLGVRLLHRTTRRLQVTAEGAALLQQGRPLMEDLEALTNNLASAGRDVTGTLRVTIPASFGRQYISPALPRFLSLHPGLKLHVAVTDQRLDLVSEGLDLAIRIGELEDSSLVARRVAANTRVLCASPEYLRRRGVPKRAEDLAAHDCLLLVGNKGAQNVWRMRAPDGAEAAVRVRGPLESNFGEVLRDAALAGLGIALHSTWHVCEDLKAGRLQRVLQNYALPQGAIYAVMPPRRLILPRVCAFVEYLSQHFGDAPPWERTSAKGRRQADAG